MSRMNASCKNCCTRFKLDAIELVKDEHLKLTKEKFDKLPKLGSNKGLDRNLKKVIMEDLVVNCKFSDCESCSQKEGAPMEQIIKHQRSCHACDDCSYLCCSPDCDCNDYYRGSAIQDHYNKISERLEAKRLENERIAAEQVVDLQGDLGMLRDQLLAAHNRVDALNQDGENDPGVVAVENPRRHICARLKTGCFNVIYSPVWYVKAYF